MPRMGNDFPHIVKFMVEREDRREVSHLYVDKDCSTLLTVPYDKV
jgi:hypothetical protein